LDQRTPEAMQRAIEFFQHATVADPTYSVAWANLAMAYGSSAINSDVDPRRVSPPLARRQFEPWPPTRTLRRRSTRSGT
jgi:hypothetical protein